jgi:hypothetical protein
MKMRLWEKFVSLAALLIIVSGTTLAWNHEHAESNLQRWYNRDNETFFNGKLPPVWIHFGDLTKEDADGETKHNDITGFEIIVDGSSSNVRHTLRHESCHVFVDWKESEMHGAMFQECMKRFD